MKTLLLRLLTRHRQFLLFAAIGGTATFVDMGALWVALHFFGANPYLGRVFSFLCAATFTWVFNRNITFKGPRTYNLFVEYARFLGVAVVGFTANFLLYSLVLGLTPKLFALDSRQLALLPYAGVVIGSGAGLLFNYLGTRKLVFKPPSA